MERTPLPSNATAAEIAEAALEIVARECPTREFKIRSLFPADEWEALHRGQRQVAGKLFKASMMTQNDLDLRGPNSANHQRYHRTE